MKKLLVTVLSLGISILAVAHEGHDDAPGALKANHGGTVKSGKEINLEYVVSGSGLKVFPISHDGKDVPPTEVKVTGTQKSPKGKAEPVKFAANENAYLGTVDFKGAYRVEVTVLTDHQGKKDTFKFQVEK
jgi:hypothetical protein